MSQYPGAPSPGAQPPGGPWYPPSGQQEPYAPPPQPSDPYFGQPAPSDPYAGWSGDPYAQQGYPPSGQAWPTGYQNQGYPPQGYPPQGGPQGYWQAPPPPPQAERRGGSGAAIVGIFLVLLGIWFLFREQIGLDFGRVWPAAAVALGVIMVLAAFLRRS